MGGRKRGNREKIEKGEMYKASKGKRRRGEKGELLLNHTQISS